MALFTFKESKMEKKPDHTVEYTSIDYHSMCEKSKKRVKEMQQQGIPTMHDSKSTPDEVGQMPSYSIVMMG
jgi:hypothetical protein